MQLTYYFALDFQIYEAEKLLPEVDKKKPYIDCYSFLRDVCSSSLLRNPVKLRGSGINSQIIEIDESLFWPKMKISQGYRETILLGFRYGGEEFQKSSHAAGRKKEYRYFTSNYKQLCQ